MHDIDWSKTYVKIQEPREEGGISVFVRIPCYLSVRPGPYVDDGPPATMLRERLTDMDVILGGDSVALERYQRFLGAAMQVSKCNDSIMRPDGELYIVVHGWLMQIRQEGLLVHIGYEGCGASFATVEKYR